MRLDLFVDGAALMGQVEPKLDQLRKSTQDLEAVFMKDLISAMRKSVPKTEVGTGFGSEIYEDMFDQALAQSSSKSGAMGIGKLIFERMSPAVVAQEKTRLLLQASEPKTDNKG
jgi:Rod binding domain-containing protein